MGDLFAHFERDLVDDTRGDLQDAIIVAVFRGSGETVTVVESTASEVWKKKGLLLAGIEALEHSQEE